MSEKFSDELISAYLDGELTADEQLQVERVLAENPQYQQMFEELCTLRGNLQSLPSYQLDDQFADRVLRRAEKEMLSPPSDSSGDAEPPSVHRQQRSWRGIILSVASLAAMVIIALFVIAQMSNTDVKLASTPESSGVEDQSEPASNMPSADSDAEDASALERSIGKGISKKDFASSIEGLPGNARQEMKRKSTLSNKGANEGAQAVQGASKPGLGGGRGGFGASNSPKSNQAAGKGGNAHFKSAVGNKAKVQGLSSRAISQSAPAAADEISRSGIAAKKSLVEMLPRNSAEKDSYSYRTAEQLADDLFIVTLTVTPQARSSGALYRALQKHRILPQENLALDATKSPPNKKSTRLLQEEAESDVKELAGADRLSIKVGLSSEMELIYVQANYRQIQAALNELKQQAGFSGLALQSLSMEREEAAVPAAIPSAPVQAIESATQRQPSRAGLYAGKKTIPKPADGPGGSAPQSQSATTPSSATKSDSQNRKDSTPLSSKPANETLAENNSNWPLGKYRRITKQALEQEDTTTPYRSFLAPHEAIGGLALRDKLAKKESEKIQALNQQPQALQQAKSPAAERPLDERAGRRQNRAHLRVRVLIVVRTVASPDVLQAEEGAHASPKPSKP